MLPDLPKDSLVLDVGSGRGLWAAKLVGLGYRVLGIDYIEEVVKKANDRIRDEGYQDRARFLVADVLDIPFVDAGFDLVTDVGTLQHLTHDLWDDYVREVARVLKPGGYMLKVSLSRKTTRFLGWNPGASSDGEFTKFGVHYHFFTEAEVDHLFSDDFDIIEHQYETYNTQSDPGDAVTLLFTLIRKK